MHADTGPDEHATLIAPVASVVPHQGMAWLEGSTGERLYVQSELRIGRGDQNDLQLTDTSVSRVARAAPQ